MASCNRMAVRFPRTSWFAAVYCASAFCVSAEQKPGPLPRSTPEQQGISSAAILDFIQSANRRIDAMASVGSAGPLPVGSLRVAKSDRSPGPAAGVGSAGPLPVGSLRVATFDKLRRFASPDSRQPSGGGSLSVRTRGSVVLRR